MKTKDIHALSVEDIEKRMSEARRELMKLNAQIASGTTPSSPGQVKQLKKTIAKLATELKRRGEKKHE